MNKLLSLDDGNVYWFGNTETCFAFVKYCLATNPFEIDDSLAVTPMGDRDYINVGEIAASKHYTVMVDSKPTTISALLMKSGLWCVIVGDEQYLDDDHPRVKFVQIARDSDYDIDCLPAPYRQICERLANIEYAICQND